MGLNRRRALLALFVGIGASAGVVAYLLLREEKPEYQTARIERGAIVSSVSATGISNAKVSVQVGSQVSGNIKELYADFNTKVTKGQLVALIDPALFQARVQQAQASVDSARAAVGNAQAQVQRATADLAGARASEQSAKANVSKTKVAVADAKSKLGRRTELVNQGLVAREDLDTAQATFDSAGDEQSAAEAQLASATSSIRAAEAQRQVSVTQVTTAQAQVKQAEAALQQAAVDLANTQIRAPVDGTVVARRMDVGQTVAASFQAPTIFEIAQDLTQMQVDANVDEADIGRVREGQSASFSVDAYPGATFKGAVAQIRKAPINTQNVVTYDVVVAVANPDLRLYPGMTANVRILTEQRQNVLKVPNAALRFRPPASSDAVQAAGNHAQVLYELGQDGRARPIRIHLGLTDGAFTEVQSGELQEGELVVTSLAGKAAQGAAKRPPTGGRGRGPGF